MRQLFFWQQKGSEVSWRSYIHAFALSNYFSKWINELKGENFNQLKKLLVAEQLKCRAPNDLMQHFLDQWNKMIDPLEVAKKVDEYKSLRDGLKKNTVHAKAKDIPR